MRSHNPPPEKAVRNEQEPDEKNAASTADVSQAITVSTAGSQPETWEKVETAGAPTARHEAALVAFNEKIYLIGGRRINPVDVFNPKTGKWKQKAESPIELHHFQAVVHQDLIYLIGAMTGPFPNEKPVERVVAYNPQEDEFEFLHRIPVDRRRGAAGAVVCNEKIYVVGGSTNGHVGGFQLWLDEYDPATGEWRVLDDAPHARDHFQAVTDGKRLYTAGGRKTSQGTGQLLGLTVRPVDVFDFETMAWLNDSASLPTRRAGNMAVFHDGALIVGGGETDQDMAHNEVESLDIKSGKWSDMPRLAVGRHGSGFAVVGDYVYNASGCGVRGGFRELTSVERLRISKPIEKGPGRWRKYDGNRIAISADGNSEPDNKHKWPTGDPDDWDATPVTLAIIAAKNYKSKLTHFSSNNFVGAPAGPDSKNQMKIGIDGARKRWGFRDTKFFDVTKQKSEAIDDLASEIAKSPVDGRRWASAVD